MADTAKWRTAAILYLLANITATFVIGLIPTPPPIQLTIPPSHIALSGDVHVQITGTSVPGDLYLELYRQDNINLVHLHTIFVLPVAQSNVTVIKLPCGLFSRGGPYFIRLVRNHTEEDGGGAVEDVQDARLSKELDVRWPSPRLTLTPEHVQTYPEDPVSAILEFPEVVCPPTAEKVPSAIPEFWLELHFCGPSLVSCDTRNSTSQLLYSEQVRGFPGRRTISLRCELFGLAGHYALVLRPTGTLPPPSPLTTAAVYLKAEWSSQFVFNVHARSIIPCDTLSGESTCCSNTLHVPC